MIVSLPQSTCASFHSMKCSMKLPTHGTSYHINAHSKDSGICLYLAGMRYWYYLMLAFSHANKTIHYKCTVPHADTHTVHTQHFIIIYIYLFPVENILSKWSCHWNKALIYHWLEGYYLFTQYIAMSFFIGLLKKTQLIETRKYTMVMKFDEKLHA